MRRKLDFREADDKTIAQQQLVVLLDNYFQIERNGVKKRRFFFTWPSMVCKHRAGRRCWSVGFLGVCKDFIVFFYLLEAWHGM